jgi:hypothetical protein
MSFRFEPDLFEHRSAALCALSEAGYDWLAHFRAVDLRHDVYGLEVCGIAERDDARRIERLLRREFPTWRFSRLTLKDWGDRDLGWRVLIHRDRDGASDEKWQTT